MHAIPPVRLGVNIDHVATLRNARGGTHPDPVLAAHEAVAAGAHGITAHLREDRRHIRDADISRLKAELTVPLNLEMAATEEMTTIALAIGPHAACLVPERREEVTTEGGLDVHSLRHGALSAVINRLNAAGIRVSLFIDPDLEQVEAAFQTGAPVIELHTGQYCKRYLEDEANAKDELLRLKNAAAHAAHLGLEVHAGHGLDFETASHLAAFPEIQELNIGHFLIGEAVFMGLAPAIRQMNEEIARGVALRQSQ